MGLYKRKDSPFWWMSLRGDCRRIFESTNTEKKKLAERIYAKRLLDIQSGCLDTPRPEGTMLFSELATRYVEWAQRQKGIRRKEGFVKALTAIFGDLPLKAFTTQLVESYQSKLLSAGRKPATPNRHVATLKHMFTKAVDWELVDESVRKRIRRAKLLKEENMRLRYLSAVECRALIEASEPHLKPIVITALNTGMRKGEIFSLQWERHVDLKHGFILLDITKNGHRREIPINRTLRETLQGLVRHIKSPYVFTNRWGKPFTDLKKSFKLACKRAETERCLKCQYATHKVGEGETGKCPECGKKLERRCITDFRFHDLRHTAASHMIMSGVDIVTVKEILGHKSLTMTLRYAHLAPSHRRKAVDALEKCYDSVTLGRNQGNSDSQLCLFPKSKKAATY